MTESAEKEPTMEEILSSIRRIISEEDEEAAPEPARPAPHLAAAQDEPDVLELTDPLDDEAPRGDSGFAGDVEILGDDILVMDQIEEPAPRPAAAEAQPPRVEMAGVTQAQPEPEAVSARIGDAPQPAPAPAAGVMNWGQDREEGAMGADKLVGEQAASAAAGAFARLARSTRVPEATDDKSLEAIVRELLRPMLKDWLDRNLPAIVEAKVREEVERIARL